VFLPGISDKAVSGKEQIVFILDLPVVLSRVDVADFNSIIAMQVQGTKSDIQETHMSETFYPGEFPQDQEWPLKTLVDPKQAVYSSCVKSFNVNLLNLLAIQLLSLNTGASYVGSGGFGWTSQLPGYSNSAEEGGKKGRAGYDYKNSEVLAVKIADYFRRNQLDQQKGSVIHSPAELSVQAGRGLMYSNGRLGQIIMSNNSEDGYAINGWSGGSSILPVTYGPLLEWYSAMVDEGRNLKGPAEDLAYWIRPLQIAIFRMNGKYFEPGDTLRLKVDLINESILEAGTYDYRIGIRDGAGKLTAYHKEGRLVVSGGDCYAQSVEKELEIPVPDSWHGGYLTIEGSLVRGDRIIADGIEQVLLKNRPTFMEDLRDYGIEVHNWPAAESALAEAGVDMRKEVNDPSGKVILSGEVQSATSLRAMLKEVDEGARMIIRFDSLWADRLYDLEILSRPVTQWGGHQLPYWNGNGWGFIRALPGSMSHPGKGSIGTNSWEVPGDPVGFYPFKSVHPQTSYGTWFARPDSLLTLFGEISYGKGRILLAPAYPVDAGNAFNDLIFFNMIQQ